MEATVANAQAALDSQLAYWDNYLANVEVLKNTSAEDLGITQENYEALMAYAQDGSEQAAGLAASSYRIGYFLRRRDGVGLSGPDLVCIRRDGRRGAGRRLVTEVRGTVRGLRRGLPSGP